MKVYNCVFIFLPTKIKLYRKNIPLNPNYITNKNWDDFEKKTTNIESGVFFCS